MLSPTSEFLALSRKVHAMHWWQSPFSSSTRTSSPSNRKVHSDDSVIVSRGGTTRGVLKSALFGTQISRKKKKPQHRGDHNVDDDWRSQCSYENSTAEGRPRPQPLPLPDLHAMLHHHPNLVQAPSVPLPSPRQGISHHKGGEETDRDRLDGFNVDVYHHNGGATREGYVKISQYLQYCFLFFSNKSLFLINSIYNLCRYRNPLFCVITSLNY